MTSLVLQLQADTLDQSVRVSSILRKALAVSRKLAILEIESWLKQELDGYGTSLDLPLYRTIQENRSSTTRTADSCLSSFRTRRKPRDFPGGGCRRAWVNWMIS